MPLEVDGPRNEEFYTQISPNPVKQESATKISVLRDRVPKTELVFRGTDPHISGSLGDK